MSHFEMLGYTKHTVFRVKTATALFSKNELLGVVQQKFTDYPEAVVISLTSGVTRKESLPGQTNSVLEVVYNPMPITPFTETGLPKTQLFKVCTWDTGGQFSLNDFVKIHEDDAHNYPTFMDNLGRTEILRLERDVKPHFRLKDKTLFNRLGYKENSSFTVTTEYNHHFERGTWVSLKKDLGGRRCVFVDGHKKEALLWLPGMSPYDHQEEIIEFG